MNGEKHVPPILRPGQALASHDDPDAKQRYGSTIKNCTLNRLEKRSVKMRDEETKVNGREGDPGNGVYQPKE